jgi:predicted XRE-type DNA-binding protein
VRDLPTAGVEPIRGTTVVVGQLFRVRRGKEKRFVAEQPKEPAIRPAKVALQLALAHRIQKAIEAGEVRDQAEAARLLGLTRARVSQLLDLTLLAPDIQERILLLEAVGKAEPASERELRSPSRAPSWSEQRVRLWNRTAVPNPWGRSEARATRVRQCSPIPFR